jgi:translocation and assembly module TamB
MEKAKRKIPLWLRIALGVVVAIFALIAAGVALRYWITSDAGRAFVVSQIDGRKIGPLGTIRVEGLQGDPLQAATFADIALVDDDGIWLRARNARLEWTPEALFAGNLEIQAIHIGFVDMLRMPRTTYESENRPPPDIGLKLDEIVIDEFRIADNVLGPTAASYRIAGGAARGRDGAGFARLSVAPLSGPPDNVEASAEWTAEGGLSGKAIVTGPPGGVIAALLQAPADTPVALTANVSGTITDFTGLAGLDFSGQSVAQIDIKRAGDEARLSASLAADRWPLLAPLADRAGGGISLAASANLADMKRAPIAARITATAGQIDIAGRADFEALSLPEEIELSTRGLDLAFIAPPLRGKIDATGEARLVGLTDFVWEGRATATNLEYPSGAINRVTSPVTIRKDRSTISWELPRAIVEGGRVTPLKSLAPANYTVATRGEVNLMARTVEVTQAQITGSPGQVTGRGVYTINTGAFEYSGAASFNRLADLVPLTGAARGQWSVRRSSHNAPIRITGNATGRNVSSRIAVLADLAGPSPVARMTGVVSNGRFVLESGNFRGAGLNANMTGRITDNGAVVGRAAGTLSRPLALPGATISSATFAAEMSGQLSAPQLEVMLSNGTVVVAGITVSDIVGEAQASLGDRIRGDFSLSGGSWDQPVRVAGRLDAGDGDWRITNLDGHVGEVAITAERLSFTDGVFSTEFDASGSLAGLGGLDRGAVTARGAIRSGDELVVDVAGQFTNLRSGTMRVELLSFDADVADNRATVAGRLRGTFGAPVNVAFNATGQNAAEAWSGTATLDGEVDEQPIATARPASWKYGADGWAVDAQLAAFGGRMDADASSSDTISTASFDVADLDLRALSRLAHISPINGRVTGKSTFSNDTGRAAQADVQINIADANPEGVTADPLGVEIMARLRDGELTTVATGSGQGFRLEAGSMMRMDDGGGFNVTPNRDAPLEARVSVTGRAEQLWALFGPDGQVLRGNLDGDVRVSGTLNRPTMAGGVTMAEGVYEHGETGLRLQNIAARGEFDQRSARITEFSADDGQGGSLSGNGNIDWEEGLDGGVQFAATSLRALGRDDRNAIVTGQGAVTIDEEAIRVTGELDVEQARISIEQPAAATIPTLPAVRRINFPNQEDSIRSAVPQSPFLRPVQLDLKMNADRRIMVTGRGLDTEWSADLHLRGPIANPEINGTATLIRGDLDLAGRRFTFDTGSITLDGPIRNARLDISAERAAQDIVARVHVTGSPAEPKFELESTPALPQDEILARVLFGRSASQLTAFETAQLAAGLAQLAGGQAGFDPAALIRQATGLDRVAIGASDGVTTVSAGKYIAENVFVQVGSGSKGGIAAEVEWQPRDNLSIVSGAQDNGDTKISVRGKNDY